MDITLSPSIKKIVMRRVRVIWFMRRVLPLLVLETLAVMLIARQLAESIFFNQVLQNAIVHTFTRSPVMMADFFFRAFMNTDTIVQLLVAGSLLVGVLFAWDAFRTFRTLALKSNLSPLSHVI
ncbi:MAG: hypothetical protein A3H64_00480 [Candidatus Ryanbacteria bacterium RIFCSPLOWO2_02_FULL_45_11c]|uniref:Uncharacterized protein n=1 Tax=Candidatus Ryanbacteria bacterium RIFCSPLOWO2_02_FULL_45_11c TaxID=1802128 RepID=A0A1G2GVV7_9BACT|nr:MAG: hypothetical protein A3H64_00480 [Candidatus Ryanbacteria bacterium RIFCSPLOWO2_02_FULL_45_11c]